MRGGLKLPARLSPPIQEQLRQASGLPVSDVRTMEEVVSRSISRRRQFNMLPMFGGAAVLPASIGVCGLTTCSVQPKLPTYGEWSCVFIVVPALPTLIALIVVPVPAIRATQIDPMAVLRTTRAVANSGFPGSLSTRIATPEPGRSERRGSRAARPRGWPQQ